MSHTVHHLSFGEDYPGIVNPLDGVTQTADESKYCCMLGNFACFLSPDPKRIGGYSDQPGVRPSVRLSVRLSVRRQKLVRSITFIPFEIF